MKQPLLEIYLDFIKNTTTTHSSIPITGLERLGKAICSLATISYPTENETEKQLQKAMKQKNYSELKTLIETHRKNISEEFKPEITTFLQEAYQNDSNNCALLLLKTKWEMHLHYGY